MGVLQPTHIPVQSTSGASMPSERHPMATKVLPTHNDKSDESGDLLGQWVPKAGQGTGP